MNKTGWVIRPIGWIVIAALLGLTLYYYHKKRKRPKPGEDGTHEHPDR